MHHETRPTTVHTRRLTIRESVAAIAERYSALECTALRDFDRTYVRFGSGANISRHLG